MIGGYCNRKQPSARSPKMCGYARRNARLLAKSGTPPTGRCWPGPVPAWRRSEVRRPTHRRHWSRLARAFRMGRKGTVAKVGPCRRARHGYVDGRRGRCRRCGAIDRRQARCPVTWACVARQSVRRIEWGQSRNKGERAGRYAGSCGQRRDPVIDRRPASSSPASPIPVNAATRPRCARNRVAFATAYPPSAAGTRASPSRSSRRGARTMAANGSARPNTRRP